MQRPVSGTPLRSLADSVRPRRTLIRLTPLIDVVFILVVFFMLASSFSDWRAIDLTMRGGAAADAPMVGALLLEIRRDGLRLSGESVSIDDLGTEVARRAAARPGLRVLVRPDQGVSLQEAVRVLDRLAGTGASGISLIRASHE